MKFHVFASELTCSSEIDLISIRKHEISRFLLKSQKSQQVLYSMLLRTRKITKNTKFSENFTKILTISKQKCCSSHWFLHISGNHWNFMNFQAKGGPLSWAFYSPAECNFFPSALRKPQKISQKIIENHYFSKVVICPLNFPLSDQCTPPEAPKFSWNFLKISWIFLNFLKTDP